MFRNLSVKWKIYLIAIVSIIGFGGYLGYNVWVNTKNAELLTQLQDAYFPILEKSTSNGVQLDLIKELLQTGILTGETEYTDKAQEIADGMNNVYDQIIAIEPHRKSDIKAIKKLFNEYFEITKGVSLEMISDDFEIETLSQKAMEKEEKLSALNEKTTAFTNYARDNFSQSIETANTNSRNMLTSGFIIWSVSILLMGITVIAVARLILSNINQISSSLAQIAKGQSDFANSITVESHDEIGRLAKSFNALMDNLKVKTNDLMSMMQHMHTGLFTITEDETIHKEYSTRLESIFETNQVAGEHYFDLLFAHAQIGSDVRDQMKAAISSLLGADEMIFEFNSHLLISEFTAVFEDENGNQKTKYIEVDWDAIVNEEIITRIMVTVRDVTEIKAMQAEAAHQKLELEIVGQILKLTPARFKEFAQDTDDLLRKNHQIVSDNDHFEASNVAQLFANMHTIKGNARTYQLTHITDIVHEAEVTYDELRKSEAPSWPKERMLDELLSVREALTEYTSVLEDKLSFAESGSASSSPDQLVVERERYDSFIHQLDSLSDTSLNSKELSNLITAFRKLDAMSLEQSLEGLINSLTEVAIQIEKEPPSVQFTGDDVSLKRQSVRTIVNVFSHVLKNSIDHGLELPEDRIESGKSPEGKITVHSIAEDNSVMIEVSDDGRGLNIGRLLEKVKENNSNLDTNTLSAQDVANSIFESGMSTAEKLTDISGRGVGMDAVKKYLNNSGSDINVVLNQDASLSNEFEPFKLVIRLSDELCFLPNE